jgi:hypothetical protein
MGKRKILNRCSSVNNPNYFKFGLRGSENSSVLLLKEYPMQARNRTIASAQVMSLNTILSNIPNGSKLSISNFSKLTNNDRGFSRQIFLAVLNHLVEANLMTRDGNGYSKSEITYLPKIMRYIPGNIVNHPEGTIITNIKGEGRKVVKINTEERRILNSRLKSWWGFVRQHKINPGITTNEFKLFNERETLVFGKTPLIKPQSTDILPYIIYNDRDLTMGGRMYGAFWIGMKKELRRAITIDGSKTCDIDGKGMHVQLLYKSIGEPVPEGDMYIYTDERRSITKGLMLLMMNTAKEYKPESGRKQVKRTYRKRFSLDEGLEEYILDLEGFHHKILHLLYHPNWGQLQHTEAVLMLNIMEAAMNEDIVVLPVHDGCLCKLEHKEKVLQFFTDQGIEAEENEKHLLPLPLKETRELLKAFSKYKKVA